MTLKELSTELVNARRLESEAINKRIEIENQIIQLMSAESAPDLHIVSSYSYQVDPCDLMLATMNWPADLQPAYLSPKLDEKRLKKIMSDLPALWSQIAHLVDVQPMRVNLSVEVA